MNLKANTITEDFIPEEFLCLDTKKLYRTIMRECKKVRTCLDYLPSSDVGVYELHDDIALVESYQHRDKVSKKYELIVCAEAWDGMDIIAKRNSLDHMWSLLENGGEAVIISNGEDPTAAIQKRLPYAEVHPFPVGNNSVILFKNA
jgi:hypothetical protein